MTDIVLSPSVISQLAKQTVTVALKKTIKYLVSQLRQQKHQCLLVNLSQGQAFLRGPGQYVLGRCISCSITVFLLL